MELIQHIDKYKHVRYKIFKWLYELNVVHKLVLSFGFACLTGLLAQIRFYLQWTPVPITGQTFGVMLSAILLGRWGWISQVLYVALGALGIPWFAGGKGGIGTIIGPTGGYIIGFVFAAFFLGHFVDKYIRSRNFLNMFVLMFFANFVLIHGSGLLQLYIWLSIVKGSSVGLKELLMMGTFPFIIGDVIKIVVVAGITNIITPKRRYDVEANRKERKKLM